LPDFASNKGGLVFMNDSHSFFVARQTPPDLSGAKNLRPGT
jgi:hypothetical protein